MPHPYILDAGTLTLAEVHANIVNLMSLRADKMDLAQVAINQGADLTAADLLSVAASLSANLVKLRRRLAELEA